MRPPRGPAWHTPGRVGGCDSDLMAESFYPDFYVTCATVIPVLLLVVAVQARTYESALAREQRRGVRGLLLTIAYVSVVLGGVGELGALVELLVREDTPWWRVTVLVATLLLLVVVLYGPFLGFLRATSGSLIVDQAASGAGGGRQGEQR